MTIQTNNILGRHGSIAGRIVPDRRRHKRVPLTLLGRFMRPNKQEHPCRLQDISVGGAAILAPVAVEDGERIIAYFDHLGGLEGTVVRSFEGGFGMKLSATIHKREKLAAQLTWLINRGELSSEDERRHERIVPKNGSSFLKIAEGHIMPCRVLDVSISGASIGTEARPPLGQEVTLGRLRAIVVRYHEQGIGVQFVDIQNPNALRRDFD